jgi:hypothetical protein
MRKAHKRDDIGTSFDFLKKNGGNLGWIYPWRTGQCATANYYQWLLLVERDDAPWVTQFGVPWISFYVLVDAPPPVAGDRGPAPSPL